MYVRGDRIVGRADEQIFAQSWVIMWKASHAANDRPSSVRLQIKDVFSQQDRSWLQVHLW